MIDTAEFRRKRTEGDGSIGDRTASAIDSTSQLQAVEEGIAGHKSGWEEEEEGSQRTSK